MHHHSLQGWRDLPHHLLEPVLAKLQTMGGVNSAASVRLVCKSWLAAFEHFPGAAALKIQAEAVKPLEKLFGLMPNISELRINSADPRLDLSPLQARSHLTCLSYIVTSSTHHYHPVDLSLLPKALKELTLEGVQIQRGSHSRIVFVGLTKLVCVHDWTPEVWVLLHCLPALKVIFLAKVGFSIKIESLRGF